MASGWLKGTVKAVQNGDTLIIMGAPRPNAPPLEKTITLSSLIAPRLVSASRFSEIYLDASC